MKEALFYEKAGGAAVRCLLCPHRCAIEEGRAGRCGVRRNSGGKLFAESYGQITALAVDPIEKKPLRLYHPGSRILSVGSYGCNMDCAFCQNAEISADASKGMGTGTGTGMGMGGEARPHPRAETISPEQLALLASHSTDNLGVAFTYNEPLIAIEYMLDAAPLLKERGLKVVLVTNGMVLEKPLDALLPFVDGMNIDLKAFRAAFYQKHGGDLETVKKTIERSAFACHLEVTTLVIPGQNDSEQEIGALSRWIASVSYEIPLHLSRFFPRRAMTDTPPTPIETLQKLGSVAGRSLKHVFIGNV